VRGDRPGVVVVDTSDPAAVDAAADRVERALGEIDEWAIQGADRQRGGQDGG
jgi:hypothetical protein